MKTLFITAAVIAAINGLPIAALVCWTGAVAHWVADDTIFAREKR